MATSGGRPTTAVGAAAGKPGDAPAVRPAQPAAPPPEPGTPADIERRLFGQGYNFDFFQAVRLLEAWRNKSEPVGRDGPSDEEAVRFAAHLSFAFPPSTVVDIQRPGPASPVPKMTVSFMGLTGPSGVLPQCYTEMMLRLERDTKHPEKQALRAWFDLFNHRLISHFYRAWEKYRFYIPYERGEPNKKQPDTFTHALLSTVGLGLPSLRNRMRVAEASPDGYGHENVFARVDDLALAHYAGLLSQQPRTAVGLQSLLSDFFGLPVEVLQFQGEWLRLEPQDQTELGCELGNCRLGLETVVGERVWDIEGRVLIRLGPLDYEDFVEFLPDDDAIHERKALFVLSHLARLYLGPAMNFDVQLTLKPHAAPPLELAAAEAPGSCLGWNSWLAGEAFEQPLTDAIFAADDLFVLEGGEY